MKYKLNTNAFSALKFDGKFDKSKFNHTTKFLDSLFELAMSACQQNLNDSVYSIPSCFDMLAHTVTEKTINKVFIDICKYLKLDHKFLKLNIENIKYINSINCYGFFKRKGYIAGEITLYIHKYFTIKSILGTLIHEMTHAFCHLNQLDFDDFNEECTDIMIVLLGFGEIIIDCYKDIYILDNSKFFSCDMLTIGYLNSDELSYIYSKTTKKSDL